MVALAESESENLNLSPPIQLEVAESSSRLNRDVHRRFTINELSKQAICIATQSQHCSIQAGSLPSHNYNLTELACKHLSDSCDLAHLLEALASFHERIETVSSASGGYVYIQRPKGNSYGAVRSVDDLPDDLRVIIVALHGDW